MRSPQGRTGRITELLAVAAPAVLPSATAAEKLLTAASTTTKTRCGRVRRTLCQGRSLRSTGRAGSLQTITAPFPPYIGTTLLVHYRA